MWAFFFSSGNLVCAYDKRCSTGFNALNVEHPGTLWLGERASLCPFGEAAGLARAWRWPEAMVTPGRAGICCLCELLEEGRAVRVKNILGRLCQTWPITWFNLALCLLALANANPHQAQSPSRKSMRWGRGKDQVSPCQGSELQPHPLGAAAPLCPQDISMHWVRFQSRCPQCQGGCTVGACTVKQGVNKFDPQKIRFRCKLHWKSHN